ncbi:MAG TPA: endonuclease/exonuclease/phosphatase family protein, partial [Longimicrobiales bacterium]|nr:endonuclease/exonuclease/phosphatase family protein [Longimicrobiales bacterium]
MNHTRRLLERDALWLTVGGALGVWIGVHVLRNYLVVLIFYVSRQATAPEQIGIVSLGVFGVGLLGGVASRFLGGAHPAQRFGAFVAVLVIAAQVLPVSLAQPAAPFAAWVAWLWWCPEFLREMARRGVSHLIAPSVVLGLAAQVAGQTALHGLDVPLIPGRYGLAGNVALAGAFITVLFLALPRKTPATDPPARSSPWMAFAIGPFLHVQLTLLANLGGLQVLTGWSLAPVALFVGISMGLGLAALRWPLSRRTRLALGLVAVLLLATLESLNGWAALAIIPIQIAVISLLHGVCQSIGEDRPGVFYGASAAGWIVFFGMIYGFYAVDAPAETWAIAVLAMTAASGWRSLPSPMSGYRLAGAATIIVVVGVGIHLGTQLANRATVDLPDRPPQDVRVMTYNIHQGFDQRPSPTAPAIADVIEQADADLVALQEVNRGANIAGGADLIAYLRWRFPDHHVVFAPSYTNVMGNAIISRYPILDWGWAHYPPPLTILTRSYVWATIATDAGDLLYINTHLSSSEEPDETRAEQAEVLLAYWDERPQSILAGDINAVPSSAVTGTFVERGLTDAMTAPEREYLHRAPDDWDKTRVDYVFTSPDIEPLVTHVVFSPASDHPAVIAVV